MTEYVFADGPLAGQTTSLTTEGVGDTILIEVTGYDEDPAMAPGLTYVVADRSTYDAAGQLRLMSTDGPGRVDNPGASA